MNRDGIPDVLQQPLVGFGASVQYGAPVQKYRQVPVVQYIPLAPAVRCVAAALAMCGAPAPVLELFQVMQLQRPLLCTCTQRLRCTQHWYQSWTTSLKSSSAASMLKAPSLDTEL